MLNSLTSSPFMYQVMRKAKVIVDGAVKQCKDEVAIHVSPKTFTFEACM